MPSRASASARWGCALTDTAPASGTPRAAPGAIERGLVTISTGYVHYRAAGQGPPVVLLHINQQSSALYLELLRALAPDFRAIAIDYPGCGMSDHVEGEKTIADYAQAVVEVLDALGIARVRVIGEAVSTLVATELAVRYPERVAAAVMLNYPFTPLEHKDDHGGEIQPGVRPEDASGFPTTRSIDFLLANDSAHAPMRPTQEWMDRINVAQLQVGRDRWQLYSALRAYDFRSRMPLVACPVKILMGENFYFGKYNEPLARMIPGSRLETVPGARFCMGWEFAEEVGRRARAFFQAVAPT